jgi:hypothetical protein
MQAEPSRRRDTIEARSGPTYLRFPGMSRAGEGNAPRSDENCDSGQLDSVADCDRIAQSGRTWALAWSRSRWCRCSHIYRQPQRSGSSPHPLIEPDIWFPHLTQPMRFRVDTSWFSDASLLSATGVAIMVATIWRVLGHETGKCQRCQEQVVGLPQES